MASERTAILLVHDAFHRPVHYERVLGGLRAKGFTVAAPPLPTTGTDPRLTYVDDVAVINETLEQFINEGKETILVAHSLGALPASQCIEGESVAERAECGLKGGIRHYINVCGLAYPLPGRNILGNEDGFPLQNYHLAEKGIVHLTEEAKPIFYNDLTPKRVEEIWPSIVKTHSQKNFNSCPKFVDKDIQIPKTYVFCENDAALPKEYQAYFIDVGEYDEEIRIPSGHSPFLKMPDEMVEIISDIAERR